MADSIQIKGLCKRFPGFLLNDINLELPIGTITGLIGNNGAGKTTLIKCLTGAVIPDSGTIVFPEDFKHGDIAVVFDQCHLPQELTAFQISTIMANLLDKWDSDKFNTYMGRFKLPADKKIKTFSSGMLKKLQIAIVGAQNARLIILDEPTASLDPAARDEFLDDVLAFIQDEERTVLISSHITSDLEKIADYVAFIRDGKMEFHGEKDTILESFGILICGDEAELNRIGGSNIISVRRNEFNIQALVEDREGLAEAYPEAIIDKASLDDILVFIIRGETA